ncbi:hypothetical protein DSM104443_02083 [Usitatibacter rugosus]|uniref:Activator of Hsp90 ATPase homologue 1/2-like C-terminal domain-containing protein n=1 Tax=Usitatibacter rugosus TaxID=2732067 RepID=A0A6M4GVD8_9PROT|nr:SRPBCC family protein [Usitatibacter rugosus]QJR11012.1 hypothetical protein DSM104443_02083 [Usitatibacter rugosus]
MNDFAQAIATDTLRLERLLPGPIERVWSYLTDGEKRSQWFCGGSLEPREGGKSVLLFDHDKLSDESYPADFAGMKGKSFTGTVLVYDPPRALGYTFENGGSEVLFELTPKGKDTLLVVTHRKVATRKDMVGFSSGWDTHLGILADLLAGQKPRGFWTTHQGLRKEYEKRIAA